MLRDLREWWRWESHRRIEMTPFIRFIIAERFVKGTVLVLGGVLLVVVGDTDRFQRFVSDVQEQLEVQNTASVIHRALNDLIVRFGRASELKRDAISAGAVLYGVLEIVEGIGLIARRRWAEYLVLVATGAFLPLEIDEILRKPSPIKALALLLNIAIVAYLVWRKRLFLERPSTATAASPA